MKISAKSGGNPAPEGTHTARCYMVVDLGTQVTEWKGKPKSSRKLLLAFELPEETMVFDEKEGPRPFSVYGRFTASLHEKGVLRPLLESWRGRAFTPEELAGFDVKCLVGIPAMLSIVHKDGYANISSISKLPKGMQCPPAINHAVYFSLDEGEYDAEVFARLSDKLKETISRSPEWSKAAGVEYSEPKDDEDDSEQIPF